MTTPVALPSGWSCSTWPVGWQPRAELPLARVGDKNFPEKFCLAVHAPDMPAPGAAVIFTYTARDNAVTLLEITSVGMDVGAHLGQVLSALTSDDLQETAQQQVAAFIPARAEAPSTTPVNPKMIRRYSYVTDDHLKQVATVYCHAKDAGEPPSRAVQHHFNVPYHTATKWVGRARSAGLIGQYGKGDAS